jgi:hypothetical protein
LVREIGEEEIIAARAYLGARKAFPLNLACILGVKLPDELAVMPVDELKEEIQDLRRRLGSVGGGVGVQRAGRGPSVAPDLTPPSGVKGADREDGDHA